MPPPRFTGNGTQKSTAATPRFAPPTSPVVEGKITSEKKLTGPRKIFAKEKAIEEEVKVSLADDYFAQFPLPKIAKGFRSQQEKNTAQRDAYLKKNPEDSDILRPSSLWDWAFSVGKKEAEIKKSIFKAIVPLPNVEDTLQSTLSKLGMPLDSKDEIMQERGGILSVLNQAFVEPVKAMIDISKMEDGPEKKEAFDAAAFQSVNNFISAVSIGLSDDIIKENSYTFENGELLFKGVPIGDLSELEIKGQQAGGLPGSIAGSVVIYSRLSPFLREGLKTVPALNKAFTKAPYLADMIILNSAEEMFEATVRKTSGQEYTITDTIIGLFSGAVFETGQRGISLLTNVKGRPASEAEITDAVAKVRNIMEAQARSFSQENGRPPSPLEFMEAMGDKRVPGTEITFSELHTGMARSGFKENRLLTLKQEEPGEVKQRFVGEQRRPGAKGDEAIVPERPRFKPKKPKPEKPEQISLFGDEHAKSLEQSKKQLAELRAKEIKTPNDSNKIEFLKEGIKDLETLKAEEAKVQEPKIAEPPPKKPGRFAEVKRQPVSKFKVTKQPPKKLQEVQPQRTSRLRDKFDVPRDQFTVPKSTDVGVTEFLQKELTAPFREGFTSPRAGGHFDPKSNVIRFKKGRYGDVDTAAHEGGHYIDNEYGITRSLQQTSEKGKSNFSEPFRSELLTINHAPDSHSSARSKSAKLERKIQEGIAEFTRRYVVDPESARELAPEFYKHFEKIMPKELVKTLKAAREGVATKAAQSAEERVGNTIIMEPVKKTFQQKIRSTLDWLNYTLDDTKFGIRRFRDIAEKTLGQKFGYAQDPYELSLLAGGWSGIADMGIAKGTHPLDFKTGKFLSDIPSLKEIGEKIGNTARLHDFNKLLKAKRDLTWINQGIKTGTSKEDARLVVDLMNRRHPDFKDIEKDFKNWLRADLKYQLDSGYNSRDQFDRMLELETEYVPYNRVFDEIDNVRAKGLGNPAKARSPIKRKSKTSQHNRPIDEILFTAARNHYIMMREVRQNLVKRNIVETALKHPDLGTFIEPLKGPPPRAIQFTKESLADQLGLPENIVDKMKDIVPLYTKGNFKSSEPIIEYVVNGEKRYALVGDNYLYKALASSDSHADLELWVQFFGTPARLLRAGATLDPGFSGGTNVFRDQFSAFTQSRADYKPVTGWIVGVRELADKGEVFQAVAAEGGLGAELVNLDITVLKKRLDSIGISTKGGKVIYMADPREYLDLLRQFSKFTEGGTRMGAASSVFYKAKAEGLSTKEAGVRAAAEYRRSTTDFLVMGSVGKHLNKVAAFWNAGEKGITKFWREHRGTEKGSNPKRYISRSVATVTLPYMAAYFLSKDDERYSDLPAWRKTLFLNIALPKIVPGTGKNERFILSFPAPFLTGAVYGAFPVALLEAQEKKNLKPLREFLDHMVSANFPSPMPTFAQPLMENVVNYSFFFGRRIESLADQNVAPPDRYGVYTSETSKALANQFSRLPEPVKKLPFMSQFEHPRLIENLAYGYTATMGKYFMATSDFILGQAGLLPKKNRLPFHYTKLPVVNRFVISETRAQSKAVNDFYELHNDAADTYNSMRKNVEKGNLGRMKTLLMSDGMDKVFYINGNGEIELISATTRKVAEDLSELRKTKEMVLTIDGLDPKVREIGIIELDNMMRTIAQSALESMGPDRRISNAEQLSNAANKRSKDVEKFLKEVGGQSPSRFK